MNKTIIQSVYQCLFLIGMVMSCCQPLCSQITVNTFQKISDTEGDFTGSMDDRFGLNLTSIGDLDGDGIIDLVVGERFGDDGGSNRGAAWILFMNTDGTVSSYQKISDTQGGFTGTLGNDDAFGYQFAYMGDLDGDGVQDLAVSAIGDDDGGSERGAVWILFMNTDGTVSSHQKISDTEGGFTGTLSNTDYFGSALTNMGDLDGDGVNDLAVGVPFDDEGGNNRGTVWILFMNSDGTVSTHQKISDNDGDFIGTLINNDWFGFAVSNIGDLDNDGVNDMAVGAPRDDDGNSDRGAVWILFMNADGTVRNHQKISDTAGGFSATLDNGDQFGITLNGTQDLDGDGNEDLIVGAFNDDDGGANTGAFYILCLKTDGTIGSEQKISDTQGNFTGSLSDGDNFGRGIAVMGDLNGDGYMTLAIGAPNDDDGSGSNNGAIWVVFLDNTVTPLPIRLISFEAKALGNSTVQLEWKTASEINNDKFVVERSNDILHWEEIDIVYGAGNSNTIQSYSSYDNVDYGGVLYYRLKQVDFDGRYEYSDIRSVNVGGKVNELIIYPNPSHGQVTIYGSPTELKNIRIYNVLGQEINYQVVQENEENLRIYFSDKTQGIYTICTGSRSYKVLLKE